MQGVMNMSPSIAAGSYPPRWISPLVSPDTKEKALRLSILSPGPKSLLLVRENSRGSGRLGGGAFAPIAFPIIPPIIPPIPPPPPPPAGGAGGPAGAGMPKPTIPSIPLKSGELQSVTAPNGASMLYSPSCTTSRPWKPWRCVLSAYPSTKAWFGMTLKVLDWWGTNTDEFAGTNLILKPSPCSSCSAFAWAAFSTSSVW
mmetsp:Transcript_42891/g.99665  ORF Transcript_42891/g.99665 Transcript_42891/m.99665 type:complete len:200 (-) Transcript_42891:168-767(-)